MNELILYFAGFIMVLFGIAFYSAMAAFRKLAKTSETKTSSDEAAADKKAADKGR
jgi:hypothetical protein